MLALICVMSFFTKTTTFAATVKTVDMQDLGSGMYAYLGMLKNSKTTMYHRIKIEKKGLLLVTGGIFTSDGERYGMNTCLYDSIEDLWNHMEKVMWMLQLKNLLYTV